MRVFRNFNESIYRAPDNEGGGGADVEDTLDTGGSDDTGGVDDGGAEPSDEGSEGGKPLSVREEIKKAMAGAAADADGKKPVRDKSGRFGDRQAAPKEGDQPAPAPAPVASATPAPESLPKEAKAEWDKTPPAVQAAFVKREQDMAAGVEQLKQRYTLIDQAIAPHNDALRQMNATPADAVNRMFLWFKALAGKPADAFPALAQSMGVDWKTLIGGQQQQPGAPEPAANTAGAPEIPEPVKAYVGQLEQRLQQLTTYVQQVDGRFGNVEQNINTQNQARTEENLNLWSKDKTYFDEVRIDMAKLIETGVVPLKNGQVDLDTAYERAIYFNPEVRAKVLAEQQQANVQVQQQSRQAATTAQQTQVNKSRKAGVSLPASTTPGSTNGSLGGAAKKKPGEKLSVRDSLKAAVAQLRDQ